MRVNVCLAQQIFHGLCAHVARAEVGVFENTALLDADPRHDPFICRIDHLGEVFVRQHIVRHECPHACDDCIYLFHCFFEM